MTGVDLSTVTLLQYASALAALSTKGAQRWLDDQGLDAYLTAPKTYEL